MEPNLDKKCISHNVLNISDYVGDCLIDETTSPTSTAPNPTNATPPTVVDDSQGVEGWGLLIDLGLRERVRVLVRAGRLKEREDESRTNPICLRLIVSISGSSSAGGGTYPCK